MGIYLGGLLLPRLSRNSAFWSLLAVEASSLVLFLSQEVTGNGASVGLPPIHFTYVAMGTLMATIGMMVVVSVVSGPHRQSVDPDNVFTPSDIAPSKVARNRGLKYDYRLYAGMLAAVIFFVLLRLSYSS